MVPMAVAALALGCNEGLPTAPPAGPLVLEPGTPVTFNGAEDSERTYELTVPAGTGKLRVLLAGFTGDADVYLRFGAAPEPGSVDCASESEFELEECIVDAPTAGTWYVLVYGFSAYQNAELSADFSAQVGERAMADGVAITELSGTSGGYEMFAITVPEGLDSLVVDLNATGDPDLYVAFDEYPRLNYYACASFTETGIERCVIATPVPGRWVVRVDAYLDFSAGTLTPTFYAPAPSP
jgi:serine protease